MAQPRARPWAPSASSQALARDSYRPPKPSKSTVTSLSRWPACPPSPPPTRAPPPGSKGDKGDQGLQGDTGPGFTWRGSWSANTEYAVRDVLRHNNNVYVGTQAHTSSPFTRYDRRRFVLGFDGAQRRQRRSGRPRIAGHSRTTRSARVQRRQRSGIDLWICSRKRRKNLGIGRSKWTKQSGN